MLERDIGGHDELAQLELAGQLADSVEDILLFARKLVLQVLDLRL